MCLCAPSRHNYSLKKARRDFVLEKKKKNECKKNAIFLQPAVKCKQYALIKQTRIAFKLFLKDMIKRHHCLGFIV